MASSSRYACAPVLSFSAIVLQVIRSSLHLRTTQFSNRFVGAALPHSGTRKNIDLQRAEANDLQEVETCLEDLAHPDDPLGRVIPTRPGQKEKRYVQLLFGEPEFDLSAASPAPTLESVADKSHAGASGSRVRCVGLARQFIVIWFDHTQPSPLLPMASTGHPSMASLQSASSSGVVGCLNT